VVLQVIILTTLSDLGFYLGHLAMHKVPVLWDFHAVHHSSENLDWLASYRVHPVDQCIVKGASLIPVFSLGFSDLAILNAAAIYQWQSLWLHSNFKMNFGPLKWLIATPEFHHWHHANDKAAANKNLAGQIALWDIVFGTAHLPGPLPKNYGVNDAVPRYYLSQLFYPFGRVWNRMTLPPG
jgi:sterol desaturase/sphingolipid hydroxylase (fatty acid hydroxylase superfamily)